MNDIIEIFEEFNRKFIVLLKDILLNPGRIIKSLSDKTSTYIKPYRFFSYISSTILVIVIMLNRFNIIGFWSETYLLPDYWEEYYQSLNEVALTLFPITGFFFIITIASILSFLLFTNPKRPFKHHLFFILYLAGFLLVYYLPITFLAIFIEESSAEDIFIVILYVLLLVIPVLFVVRSQWYLGGIKVLRPIKSILLCGLTGIAFTSFYYDLELDRIANDILFFNKAKQKPFKVKYTTINSNPIYRDSDADGLWLFPVNSQTEDDQYLFGLWNFDSEKIEIHELEDTLTKVNEFTANHIYSIALYHFNNNHFAITHNHLENGATNQFWRISRNDLKMIEEDSLKISPLSSMITIQDYVLLTGSTDERQAALYKVEKDTMKHFFSLDVKNTYFDYVLKKNDTTLVTLVSKTQSDNLREISICSINLDSKEIHKQTQFFENRIAKVPAYDEWNSLNHKVYNPWMGQSIDGKYTYVAYQIRTEKNFELQIFKFDNELNIVDKGYLTNKGNLSYFYAFGIDESGLYTFGRNFILVPSDLFGSEASYPFLTRFDLSDFSIAETQYLQPLIPLNEGKKLYGGTEYQLYMPKAKLKVLKDSIELLWMYEDSIEKIKIKKQNHNKN